MTVSLNHKKLRYEYNEKNAAEHMVRLNKVYTEVYGNTEEVKEKRNTKLIRKHGIKFPTKRICIFEEYVDENRNAKSIIYTLDWNVYNCKENIPCDL